MTRDGEVKQRQHFYHHGDTICHLRSGYVTTKLHREAVRTCALETEVKTTDLSACRFRQIANVGGKGLSYVKGHESTGLWNNYVLHTIICVSPKEVVALHVVYQYVYGNLKILLK